MKRGLVFIFHFAYADHLTDAVRAILLKHGDRNSNAGAQDAAVLLQLRDQRSNGLSGYRHIDCLSRPEGIHAHNATMDVDQWPTRISRVDRGIRLNHFFDHDPVCLTDLTRQATDDSQAG